MYAGILKDITELKEAQEKLVHDAFHDPLTNLPNRALFLDRLERTVARAKRHKDYKFAVLFIDIDRFQDRERQPGTSRGRRTHHSVFKAHFPLAAA